MSSYKDAGVDIDAGNKSVNLIKDAVAETFNKNVLTKLGSFGGVFSASKIAKMKNPLLVSTIDGVGTKLKIAAAMKKWDSVGEDLVNHCSNDILALGAQPLFFLDYIASDKIEPKNVKAIVSGMAYACKELDCPIIGGETAEMPGVYSSGEHDIVGTMVGVVEKSKIIDGTKIKTGDALIGLASNGLHTNGYSLARHVLFEKAMLQPRDYFQELDSTLGDELLKIHRSYSKNVLSLAAKINVRGIAHITGGGLIENVPRIIPAGLKPKYNYASIEIPRIFKLIQKLGRVADAQMFRVFNMGVGLVVVVSKKDVLKAIEFLKKTGESPWLLGSVVSESKDEELPEIG